MAEQGYGNFAFMYNIHRGIYKELSTAEKHARTNLELTGNPIRQALELYVNDRIRANRLEQFIYSDDTLQTKISFLTSQYDLRQCGYLAHNQYLSSKPVLALSSYHREYRPNADYVEYMHYPEKDQAPVQTRSGYYYFLRKLGNAFSHAAPEKDDPCQTFENVSKALHIFHKILLKTYRPSNTPPFDENKMPIEEFLIDSSNSPDDSDYSGCQREFVAHTIDSRGNKETYALIRLYPRAALDRNFMHRNRDCFTHAAKATPDGAPGGIPRVRELTDLKEETEFYVLAYIFDYPVQQLNAALLKTMDLSQRMALCQRLLSCFATLHKAKTPIYHRLLNYQCIWMLLFEDTIWVPYVVKFDYAKIVNDPVVTIRTMALHANRSLQQRQQMAQYIPPEWKNQDDQPIDWAKVDVYSLGHLILDILYGDFTLFSADLVAEALLDMGIDEGLLNTIALMCSDDPAERCTVREALDAFRKGNELWS